MTTPDDYAAHMAPTYGVPNLTLVRGQGHLVWTEDGQEFVDLLAGIATNALGHAHPAVVAAVREQIGTLQHVSNLYAHPQAGTLMRKLAGRTGLPRAFLCNSGTEANEYALKLARARAAEKGISTDVIAFEGSFHGRTYGALSLTGQAKHRAGLGPLLPGIHHVPFVDVAAVERRLDEGACAVFIELVQGEGGVVPAPVDAARQVERACRSHGALLVVDEIQTGVHRTGPFLASQAFNLRPDVVTLAKAVGGGLPLGAACATEAAAAFLGPGRHGCTFGGNPVSCAAGNAALDALDAMGADRIVQRLHGILRDAGLRGLGLLLGKPTGSKDKRTAGVSAMLRQGFLVGEAGSDVIRIAPPLVLPEEAAKRAADALGRLA